MRKKSLPKLLSPNVKVVTKDDGSKVIRVVGIPYGGPEYLQGKDLHGEFFAPDTDYGRDPDTGELLVQEIYAFYDHALNENVGRDPIGRAKFYADTDAGQVWDIEILRAYRYQEMISMLAEKGLMFASSQPIQTSVEIDWSSGKILKWHPAEISLTLTPANPLAVGEVLKSFEFPNADEIVKALEQCATEEVAEDEAEQQPEAETETEAELDVPSFSDEIEDIFGETNAKNAEFDLKGAFESVEAAIAALTARVETVEAGQKSLATQEDVTNLRTHLDDTVKTFLAGEMTQIKAGIRTFAERVAMQLKVAVKQEVEENLDKSDAEREAEQEVARNQSPSQYIPTHAPGRS